ncbi:MAG: hypothetical protein ACYS8W_17730 [Planctomycetota bacterium]|jgi:hypothetical protein
MPDLGTFAIIFLVWGAFSLTMTVITILKWPRVYPTKPAMRWFSFLMRLFATIAFLFLGITCAIKAWGN